MMTITTRIYLGLVNWAGVGRFFDEDFSGNLNQLLCSYGKESYFFNLPLI
jgi:hypothetical protein